MKNGIVRWTTAAALAGSLAVAATGAFAQSVNPQPSSTAIPAAISPAHAPPVDVEHRVESASSTAAKDEEKQASLPKTSRFVLLGLGVVLVGVLSRQRRGFRRSGTILLR